MLQIKAITLEKLHNGMHYQFHEEIIEFINDEGSEKLKIKPLADTHKAAFKKFDDVFNKESKSPVTKQIKDKDKERDVRFTAIKETVKTALKHYSEEVRNAADKLWQLINHYGRVNAAPYNKQTALTTNFIQDLKSDKYKNDVALVRIRDQQDILEILNNEFIQLMSERAYEYVARSPEKVLDLRKDVDEAYQAIRRRINALVEVDGEENYEQFVRLVNITIDKYKKMMVQTGPRKKKEG